LEAPVISFGATKPANPEDGDGVFSLKLGKPSLPGAVVCPRKFSMNYVAAKASRFISKN